MTRTSQIQVIKLLKIYGYLLVRINRDQFNRLNGILKDRQGKRYFFKVVNDQTSTVSIPCLTKPMCRVIWAS